ncbi:hypothetical protein SUGI_0369870 [Cryptomeria japonica]|nr:hypothetical protein SUGI_0369870 [Cryptomeria japonica]
MASLIYSVINLESGKLDAIIREREKLETPLDHFRENFEWLSENLTIIRDYVRDADEQSKHKASVESWLLDEQSKHKASVESWLLDVAEIAWDVEDILEEFAIQSKATNDESSRSSCVCAFSYSKLAFRYKMTGRIKNVKGRIRSILAYVEELKLVEEYIRECKLEGVTNNREQFTHSGY